MKVVSRCGDFHGSCFPDSSTTGRAWDTLLPSLVPLPTELRICVSAVVTGL